MREIRSQIVTSSAEFIERQRVMQERLEVLRAELDGAARGGA